MGKGGEKKDGGDGKASGEQVEKDISHSPTLAASTSTLNQLPSGASLPPTSTPSTQSTTPVPAHASNIPTPTVPSSSSSPAPPQQPVSTPVQNRPTNATQPVAAASSDGNWLDRAIIGLVIALIFMITRKVVLADDD